MNPPGTVELYSKDEDCHPIKTTEILLKFDDRHPNDYVRDIKPIFSSDKEQP